MSQPSPTHRKGPTFSRPDDLFFDFANEPTCSPLSELSFRLSSLTPIPFREMVTFLWQLAERHPCFFKWPRGGALCEFYCCSSVGNRLASSSISFFIRSAVNWMASASRETWGPDKIWQNSLTWMRKHELLQRRSQLPRLPIPAGVRYDLRGLNLCSLTLLDRCFLVPERLWNLPRIQWADVVLSSDGGSNL